MSSIDFLLTHPGGAHKDEFLACCALLALYHVPVERREPEPDDLVNPSVCVIDVGHVHEPERNNFDHHQFPKNHPPTCSLSLVLQHLGLYQDARDFFEWLEPAEWFDCRGPIDTATWLGVDRDVLSKLVSPIDITLLRRFAASSKHSPGEPLWEIMRMIGSDMLDYVKVLRGRLDFVKEHSEVWTLDGQGGPAKILFLPRTEPMPDEPSMGLDQFVEREGLSDEIIGLVYPDRRGAGYGLSRYRDNARLDFTRIAGKNGVHFAHSRGFIAKTSLQDRAELKELLLDSLA